MLAVCSLLLLAVVVVFRQTVGFDFVNFDDDVYVYENPQLAHGLSAENVVWAFTTNQADNWHPLTWLSYMLDHQFCGLEPWGYHLSNVLLHAATAIGLFLVLWRMTGDLWPSAFVAAVFAIHPLRAESVAWASERKDVLSGLFFMLTLGAYVSYVRHPFSLVRYLAVVLLFALDLMAKPMVVTLPLVLLLLDYWPLGRTALPPHPSSPRRLLRLVVEKLPLLVLSAASSIVTPLAQRRAFAGLDILPLSSRVTNAVVAYVAYLGQFFCPMGLAAYYPHPEGALPAWQVAGAVLLLVGITAAALACRRRCPWLPVGWFWYLGMLVPVIGLVQVGGHSMADRYTYLPQIGLAVALAWGAKHVLGSWPRRDWLCGVVSALLVAVLMGCAWRQTSYWRDSETLWNRALDCTSRNALAHGNLGSALYKQGRVAEAIDHYREVLAITPDEVVANNNLGLALCREGLADEAVVPLRKALRLNPQYAEAHFNLGNALVLQEKLDEAMAEYRTALDLKPDYADARFNLGAVLYRRRRIPEALAQWEELIRRQPDSVTALDRMAWTMATDPEAAVRNGPRAVELAQRAASLTNHEHPGILDTLAAAYAEAGRFAEALQTVRKAIDLAAQHNEPSLAETIKAKIPLYEAGRAFREPSSRPTEPPARTRPAAATP